MNRAGIALIILITILVVACQAESTPTGTPAPVSTIGRSPFGAPPVSAISLLRNPAAFADQDVELAGQYRPLPLLVCAEDTHTSPATWVIVEDEIEILASGFDDPLRELATPGLELVVEGRWQQWEGPVGCGRRLPAEKIWYLAVSNIVSPNPLVEGAGVEDDGEVISQLSPEPAPGGSGDELMPSPTIQEAVDEPAEVVETVVLSTPTPPGTTIPPATLPLAPTATARATGSATPTAAAGVTNTPTRTPTAQATGSVTPTPTASAEGTSAATATSTSTATATTASGDFTPIGYEDLTKRSIADNDTQAFQFVGTNGDNINVAVAPENGLDVSFELIGPGGDTLATQSQYGAGQVESLGSFNISPGGVHRVMVHSVNGSGSYALVVQPLDALPFVVFQGNIAYGDTVSGIVAMDRDDHWNFIASDGDVVTIRSSATTDADLVLYLNGPDSLELDFADNDTTTAPPSDEEEIVQIQLDDTGMYTIGVGEIDFNPIAYTLTLTQN